MTTRQRDRVDDEADTGAALGVVPEAPSQKGAEIGPYRVVEEIGHGGMGTVYLAERSDGAYQQKVAVKVIRRGLETERVLRRFRTERQILAALAHPRIGRLLDGGSLRDGRPYLVMEHVAGEPIDRYCDRRRLGVRERLQLFLRVCDAVSFAHQRLVVQTSGNRWCRRTRATWWPGARSPCPLPMPGGRPVSGAGPVAPANAKLFQEVESALARLDGAHVVSEAR